MSTHHFAHAHDFNIGSLTLYNASPSRDLEKAFRCKQILYSPVGDRLTRLRHTDLYDNIAIDAVHNSAERHDAPKCHEDTRKAVQEEIFSWINGGDEDSQPKNILWLTGPAGTGKTAIAGSIADICDDRGILAGSFFFSSVSGSELRRSKGSLIATLAYNLLQHDDLQALRGPMLSRIERDPTIFRKRLKDQCNALLLKPFCDVCGQLNGLAIPKVIVIDGLDEVEAIGSRQTDIDPRETRLANEVGSTRVKPDVRRAFSNKR